MNADQQRKANSQFNKYSKKASPEDVKKINAKLGGMNRGPLKAIWDDIQKLWKMVKDPNAAWAAKAVAIGALLYTISPIDAVPDFLPGVGLLDDAGVIAAAVASLKSALNKY
ncbi:DUF1232 domain-containing protein [Halosquirtibacter laminarini]|uniref:DUF1232 domain-containing protein n=1 Tax=Halosquirtibacter laminarini TaxID=3374600 RepID=A0AC61NR86_9BACT|nr:DUF1232 domain-containing protein [Prolixibacteraceae bacterium]